VPEPRNSPEELEYRHPGKKMDQERHAQEESRNEGVSR
jgi:hypothetical protein